MSQQTPEENAPHKSYKMFVLWGVFIFVMLFVGLIGGWQLMQLKKSLDQSDALTAVITKDMAPKPEPTPKDNPDIQALQEQVNALNAALATLQKDKSDKSTEWLLSRAKHLAELAQFSLVYEHNANAAVMLLTHGEKIIARSNDLRLLPIRKAFIEDITRIKTAPMADLSHVYLTLGALQNTSQTLSLIGTHVVQTPKAAPQKKNDHWKAALDESMSRLKGLVVIRHHEEPLVPILNADYQQQIRFHLANLLGNLQWSVLHRQQEVFDESLKVTIAWIEKYYDSEDPRVKATETSLQEMKRTVVKPDWPSIDTTIALIQKAMEGAEDAPQQAG